MDRSATEPAPQPGSPASAGFALAGVERGDSVQPSTEPEAECWVRRRIKSSPGRGGTGYRADLENTCRLCRP